MCALPAKCSFCSSTTVTETWRFQDISGLNSRRIQIGICCLTEHFNNFFHSQAKLAVRVSQPKIKTYSYQFDLSLTQVWPLTWPAITPKTASVSPRNIISTGHLLMVARQLIITQMQTMKRYEEMLINQQNETIFHQELFIRRNESPPAS